MRKVVELKWFSLFMWLWSFSWWWEIHKLCGSWVTKVCSLQKECITCISLHLMDY